MFHAIMAVGKMESESWQVICPSRPRPFFPFSTQLKMSKCTSSRNCSVRIFWLWWSKGIHAFWGSITWWTDTSWWRSGQHHYTCMNCGGFRMSAQSCYDRSATKMPHVHPCPGLQICLQPCAPPRQHHLCIASTFAAITPLCKAW